MRRPDGSFDPDPYRLETRSQAGAAGLLVDVGALAEIETAVIAHCEAHRPSPPYRPQMIKERLAPSGWIPEVRVPPADSKWDTLPTNDRYDLWKVFESHGDRIGVAIEIEGWEITGDLLKFQRGLARGQIAAGVILHGDMDTLNYMFEHLRRINEPLFSDIPVLYCAPDGPGVKQPSTRVPPRYRPFLYPR